MAKSSGNAGSLFYGMSLDTKEFKKKLKDVRKTLKKSGEEMREAFTAIGKGFAIAGGAIAAGTTGMFLFAKSTAEATNEQILLADSIGATQSEIAGLNLAATRWGVEQNMLIDKMREAGGIDAFKGIADQVKNAGDETAQLAKAQELLGNEGLKLLPILQQGAGGLKAMEQEAIALGLALSPEQIAQNNAAWGTFENTMLKIEGLSKQLGTSFLEFFGTASAGIDALIDAFGTDIKAAFTELGDFMGRAAESAIKFFSEKGVPFVLAFIKLADSIGKSFEISFNFITGGGTSTLSFVKGIADSITMSILNMGNTIKAGILNSISFIIKGSFGLIEKFSTFVGMAVSEISEIGEFLGLLDEGTTDKIRTEFSKFGLEIEGLGKKFAKPFDDAFEDTTDEMAKVFEENRKESLKYQSDINKSILEWKDRFQSTSKESKKIAEVNRDAAKAVAGLSDQRTSIAITGSQEEFRIRQGGQQLALQQKQLFEMKKTRQALEKLGTT